MFSSTFFFPPSPTPGRRPRSTTSAFLHPPFFIFVFFFRRPTPLFFSLHTVYTLAATPHHNLSPFPFFPFCTERFFFVVVSGTILGTGRFSPETGTAIACFPPLFSPFPLDFFPSGIKERAQPAPPFLFFSFQLGKAAIGLPVCLRPPSSFSFFFMRKK